MYRDTYTGTLYELARPSNEYPDRFQFELAEWPTTISLSSAQRIQVRVEDGWLRFQAAEANASLSSGAPGEFEILDEQEGVRAALYVTDDPDSDAAPLYLESGEDGIQGYHPNLGHREAETVYTTPDSAPPVVDEDPLLDGLHRFVPESNQQDTAYRMRNVETGAYGYLSQATYDTEVETGVLRTVVPVQG